MSPRVAGYPATVSNLTNPIPQRAATTWYGKEMLFKPVSLGAGQHSPVFPAAVPLASGLDTGPCFGHQVRVLY